MDFIELETFLAVAEQLNISKAAERLYVSQSTITHRLQRLEDELQYKLFLRQKGKRSMELTVRGEEFMSIASRWIELYQEMELLKFNYSKTLSVAAIDSVVLTILPDILRWITEPSNHVNVKIQTEHTPDIYRLVRNREVDIGFASTDASFPEVVTRPLFQQRFVLVKGCSSPEKVKHIHPKELDPSKEIFLPWGHDYMKWHEYWWQTGTPQISVDSVMTLTHFLYDENLWAIIPISCIKTVLRQYSLQVYELDDKPPDWVCYQVKHKYPNRQHIGGILTFDKLLSHFIETTELFI